MCLHFRSTSFDTCGLVNFFCFLVVFVFVFVVVDVVVVVVVVFLGGHAILFACLSVDGHLCIYLVSPLFACFFFFLNMLYSTICVFITANNNRSFL